jgi:hypothetical protein
VSRTKRHNWDGKEIRDGQHGKLCPEPNCGYCMNGLSKFWFKRKQRRNNKKIIKENNE